MFKGLALMRKTSSKRTFNLASWHSPHSLTWSWILSLRFFEQIGFKPHFRKTGGGLGVGFGNVLSAYAYKSNSGLEWQINILSMGLHYSPQQPMWFRDMFWRADDEREALSRRVRQLERQVEAMPPSAAPSTQSAAHLH